MPRPDWTIGCAPCDAQRLPVRQAKTFHWRTALRRAAHVRLSLSVFHTTSRKSSGKYFLNTLREGTAYATITFMDWKNAGAALPPEWKEAVSSHNKSLLGKKGLGRYAWCLAAEVLLCLPPERLRELAAKLREEAERDSERFANKWNHREQTARAVAPDLRAALSQALRGIGRPPGSRQKGKE